MKKLFVLLLMIAGGGAGAFFYAKSYATARTGPSFQTAPVQRGELLLTIGATGTIEPEEVVDVGAQVAGLILEFGKDPHDATKQVDYGTQVEKGTVLARIDSTPYQAAVDQADANLERSRADLMQLEAKCELAEQELKRAEKLRPLRGIAEMDYDTAVSNYKAGKANVGVGKATIRQNEASLRVAKTNLGYTTIVSPVRGKILDRRVNIGQTVVASLNAPSLFLIAKDLRRMQVWASVNEADIGRLRLDMPVQFTVEAYPGQQFRGKVTQIRLNATMTQNVVTYTVIVATDNSSGKLLPYLTANVQFEEDRRSNVLLVPNAALRWKPQPPQIDPTVDQSALLASVSTDTRDRGFLWVLAERGFVRPVPVTVGANNGTVTEVNGGNVQDGMQVITGEQDEESGEAPGEGGGSPFLPKPPKGSRPPPGPPI